jgi:adenylate cyclase class IV
MPSNVEIKALVRDPVAVERAAEVVADGAPRLLDQEDVFFRVPQGRLKLRTFADGSAELIYYERPDEPGPRRSRYTVVEVADSRAMLGILTAALGVKGTVRKRRSLYMAGQTRIHPTRAGASPAR